MSKETILSRTDVSAVCKIHRLIYKIQSRINYFESAVANYKSASYETFQTLDDFKTHYKKFLTRLDRYKLITNTLTPRQSLTYMRMYKEVDAWSKRKDHLLELFGIPQTDYNSLVLDKNVKTYVNKLAEDQYENLKQRIKSRLTIEMSEAIHKKKFIIFNTLTVDSENYVKVFAKNSHCWRDYIRTLQRYVATYKYGSVRNATDNDYFSYFAVVERGSATKRLHIHVLMFMDTIGNLRDPNTNLSIPLEREIDDLKPFWTYGTSQPIAVRFGQHDAFGQLGWRYPVEYNEALDSWQPIPASLLTKVTAYMAKYLDKETRKKQKGELNIWKSRMTRTLGKQTIIKTIQGLPMEQLVSLVVYRKYPRPIKVYGEQIPTKLIRKLAVKVFIQTLQRKQKNLRVLETQKSFKNLLNSTINPTCPSSIQNFMNTLTTLSNSTDIYKELDMENHYYNFTQAFRAFQAHLPQNSYATPVSGGIVENIKNYT